MSLLLRLIIAAVSYLVVGIIIQAGVRGARGVEVIPNLSFWKDFPFLLKVQSQLFTTPPLVPLFCAAIAKLLLQPVLFVRRPVKQFPTCVLLLRLVLFQVPL